MIEVTPRTYVNVNKDGNGGYYLWSVLEVKSLNHVTNPDAFTMPTLDDKWLYIYRCEHFWTRNEMFIHINVFSARVWSNVYLTKEIERE
jgi:hypothetical protein